jgi:hypothetical protein
MFANRSEQGDRINLPMRSDLPPPGSFPDAEDGRRPADGGCRWVAPNAVKRSAATIFACAALCLVGGMTVKAESGWDLTARYRFNEAREAFANGRGATTAEQRLNHLGEANALLNVQPRTNANLAECIRLLEEVVAGGPTDDLGVTAVYLLGRIEEIHRPTPDIAAAMRRYRQLAESGSIHPLAQLGIVQLALLTVYRPISPLPPAERLAAAEQIGLLLKLPSAQSDFHLLLARSYLFFGESKEQALAHFLAAHQLGIAAERTRADADFSTAELAREIGRTKIAAQFYTEFLSENPRDFRSWTARQELAGLAHSPSP